MNQYKGNGFTVGHQGLHSVRYEEGGKIAIINGERLNPGFYKGPQYKLYSDTLKKWEPPNEKLVLTTQDKQKIISHVREAFDHWKFKYEIA